MAQSSDRITALLRAWSRGEAEAATPLMEAVYAELHRMAARQMRRERNSHTLQTTAVVHEAYLRLCGSTPIDYRDRSHFFAVAARQLRRVLVDHARRNQSKKRGGGQASAGLLEADGGSLMVDERLIAVDEALSRLQTLDERAAQVVELRYFGGLTEPESAEALNISITTLRREWEFARTWLASQLA